MPNTQAVMDFLFVSSVMPPKRNTLMSGYLLKFKQTYSVKIGGRRYPVVKIGNQLWMAENLKYESDNFKYPNKDSSNLELGLLYQYYYVVREIIPILPEGWRIPYRNDAHALASVIGSNVLSYISVNDGGTDEYGFNGNLPGMIGAGNIVLGFGDRLYFWYQDLYDSDMTYNFKLSKSESLLDLDNHSEGSASTLRPSAMPIRLVKDLT